jgi:FkbM family methyltransferase
MSMGCAIAVAEAFRRLHSGIVVVDYEALLTQTYSAVIGPGQAVLDIGAHAGRHTRHFARLVGAGGRVAAVEPIPHLIPGLAALSAETPWVEVHNMALGTTSGSADFVMVPGNLEQSGLREREYENADTRTETITVKVGTIDETFAAWPRLDYVKIDVEGGEVDCLNGGRATLARCRPIISVEYGRPSYSRYGLQARSLYDFATGQGFVLSDFFGNMIGSVGEWEMVCDRSYWDFFLIPTERVDNWTGLFAIR